MRLDQIAAHYAKTEAYRHACEVRYVAGLPSREVRKAYLRGVAEERRGGREAARRIIEDLNRLAAEAA